MRSTNLSTSLRRAITWLFILLLLATAGGLLAHGWTVYQKQLASYGTVSLGDSREDVRYKLGEPTVVQDSSGGGGGFHAYYTNRERDPANALPEGKTANDYDTWQYLGKSTLSHFDVYFDPVTGVAVTISCIDFAVPTTSLCPPLFGVAIDDTEANVKTALGTADRQIVEGGIKTLTYDDLGIVVRLSRRHVYELQTNGVLGRKQSSLLHFLDWLRNQF